MRYTTIGQNPRQVFLPSAFDPRCLWKAVYVTKAQHASHVCYASAMVSRLSLGKTISNKDIFEPWSWLKPGVARMCTVYNIDAFNRSSLLCKVAPKTMHFSMQLSGRSPSCMDMKLLKSAIEQKRRCGTYFLGT